MFCLCGAPVWTTEFERIVTGWGPAGAMVAVCAPQRALPHQAGSPRHPGGCPGPAGETITLETSAHGGAVVWAVITSIL
eukprot:scaffold448988_cov20-Prasinocladus_malaysianus.AAC.1